MVPKIHFAEGNVAKIDFHHLGVLEKEAEKDAQI